MTIRQLQIFLEVCNHLSITKTAQSLYLSQPAVSKAIKELEQEIGLQLFDRINGKILLNEEGRIFRIKAQQLLKDFDSLTHFSSAYEDVTPIRIGVSLTIGLKTLPVAIETFKEKYPETPLKIYAENIEQIQERLLNGDIDVAFTEGFESNQLFDLEFLSTYPIICVCGTNSTWAQKKKYKKEELIQFPFLLREKGSSLRDVFDRSTKKENIEIIPLLESVNTEVLITNAIHHMGVTILPIPLAKKEVENKTLVEIKLENITMQSTNYIVTLQGKRKNSKLDELINIFKEVESDFKDNKKT